MQFSVRVETRSRDVESRNDDKEKSWLAIQGGVFPAGAFAAGVIHGLAERGAFEAYDIRAFSGTSSGALLASLCWTRRILDDDAQVLRQNLMADVETMWMYPASPNHNALLTPMWNPPYAEWCLEAHGGA